MAPEQAAGLDDRIDARTDVYSLGVVLYESLTGEPPFRGSPRRVLAQVLDEEPRPPRSWNEAIPRDLETICLKAIAKGREHRYATAADLADDLRRFLDGEPVRARPVGPARAWWRRCRRRPAIPLMLALLAAVFLSAFGTVTWQWRRAERFRVRAEMGLDQARSRHEQLLSVLDQQFHLLDRLQGPLFDSYGPAELDLLFEPYRHLAERMHPEPELRAELATVLAILGLMLERRGDHPGALRRFQEADAAFAELASEAPGRLSYVSGWRHWDRCLFILAKQARDEGRSRDAEALFRKAEEAWTFRRSSWASRAEQDPTDRTARMSLLASDDDLAELWTATGRRDEAIEALNRGLPIAEEILRDDPSDVVLRPILGDKYRRLAFLQRAGGHLQQALESVRRSEGLFGGLVRGHPQRAQFQAGWARAWLIEGAVVWDMDRPREALGMFRRAAGLFRELLRTEPTVWILDVRRELAVSLHNVGRVQAELGEFEEALAPLRQAVTIREEVCRGTSEGLAENDAGGSLARMGEVLEHLGRAGEALGAYQKAVSHHRAAIALARGDDRFRRDLENRLHDVARLREVLAHRH
jgi:tetratricopeptide (TPR) repeat protein